MGGKRTLDFVPALSNCSAQLIEQPLPAGADEALARLEHAIPLCADESCRTVADLDRLDGKYQAINIKLDKAGGMTVALALAAVVKRRGLRIMVGGTIGTSLGIAPAPLVAQRAEIVDLDGPLCLAADRVPGGGMRAARSFRLIRSCGAGLVDTGGVCQFGGWGSLDGL